MPDVSGKRLEHVLVGSDIAVRTGVVVLLVVMMSRLMDHSDGFDGVPTAAAIPLAAYLVWNIVAMVWQGRRVRRERSGAQARQFAGLLGVGAAARVLWLLPIARDPYWRSPVLFVLLAATVITIAAATIIGSSVDDPGRT